MKTVLLTLALATGIACSLPANAEEAKTLADKYCADCHGASGNSVSSFFPSLAGQRKNYVVSRLTGFRDVNRVDPHAQYFMGRTAFRLSTKDSDALATYYAAQKPETESGPPADSAVVARGHDLYQKGAPGRSVLACATCHGPAAEGTGGAPRLASQHALYLERQLAIFRVGLRRNGTAHPSVAGLEADDIEALSAYLASF